VRRLDEAERRAGAVCVLGEAEAKQGSQRGLQVKKELILSADHTHG